MPFFLPALIGALAASMASLVGRVLLALGIGYASYSGIDVLLGNLLNAMHANFDAIPGTLWSWMGILKIQTSMSIMASALSTRVAMATVGGVVKRMVLK